MNYEVRQGQLEDEVDVYDAFWVENNGQVIAKLYYTELDAETVMVDDRQTDENFLRKGLQKKTH